MLHSFKKSSTLPFEQTIARVKEELAKEGFGVISEISMAKTLKIKLNVDLEPYTILGVCNPPFALQALQVEKEIGLMLPCNVIVYQEGVKIVVAAIKPTIFMGQMGNEKLSDIAKLVEEKLVRAIELV